MPPNYLSPTLVASPSPAPHTLMASAPQLGPTSSPAWSGTLGVPALSPVASPVWSGSRPSARDESGHQQGQAGRGSALTPPRRPLLTLPIRSAAARHTGVAAPLSLSPPSRVGPGAVQTRPLGAAPVVSASPGAQGLNGETGAVGAEQQQRAGKPGLVVPALLSMPGTLLFQRSQTVPILLPSVGPTRESMAPRPQLLHSTSSPAQLSALAAAAAAKGEAPTPPPVSPADAESAQAKPVAAKARLLHASSAKLRPPSPLGGNPHSAFKRMPGAPSPKETGPQERAHKLAPVKPSPTKAFQAHQDGVDGGTQAMTGAAEAGEAERAPFVVPDVGVKGEAPGHEETHAGTPASVTRVPAIQSQPASQVPAVAPFAKVMQSQSSAFQQYSSQPSLRTPSPASLAPVPPQAAEANEATAAPALLPSSPVQAKRERSPPAPDEEETVRSMVGGARHAKRRATTASRLGLLVGSSSPATLLVLPTAFKALPYRHTPGTPLAAHQEHFIQLQRKLDALEGKDYNDLAAALEKMEATHRSKQAAGVEKRNIRLLLNEGREMKRTQQLGVLAKRCRAPQNVPMRRGSEAEAPPLPSAAPTHPSLALRLAHGAGSTDGAETGDHSRARKKQKLGGVNGVQKLADVAEEQGQAGMGQWLSLGPSKSDPSPLGQAPVLVGGARPAMGPTSGGPENEIPGGTKSLATLQGKPLVRRRLLVVPQLSLPSAKALAAEKPSFKRPAAPVPSSQACASQGQQESPQDSPLVAGLVGCALPTPLKLVPLRPTLNMKVNGVPPVHRETGQGQMGAEAGAGQGMQQDEGVGPAEPAAKGARAKGKLKTGSDSKRKIVLPQTLQADQPSLELTVGPARLAGTRAGKMGPSLLRLPENLLEMEK